MSAEAADLDSRRIDLVGVIMGVGFALMWSSAFSAVKLALEDAPPFLLLTFRFLVAGVFAIGIALALGQRFPRLGRSWFAILVLGLCQNSLYLGLNFKAMTVIPAGLAAIIASSVPLIVALFSRFLLRERLSWFGFTGLVIGFAGVLMIMANRISAGDSAFGLLLCIIGAAALASATLIVRGVDLGTGLLMVVGLQMLVGSASLAPIVYILEDPTTVRLTGSLISAFIYITIVPGVIATLVWFHLVKRIGATQAAAYHFLNPAFGVIIASLLLAENISLLDGFGVAIIMASILMVQLSPYQR
ncbi:MAG: DMT family transporter [Geminicoccaceae bacterium]